MARRNRDDDLLLEEDELTAAFLGDDAAPASDGKPAQDDNSATPTVDDEWDEEENVPGNGRAFRRDRPAEGPAAILQHGMSVLPTTMIQAPSLLYGRAIGFPTA